MKNITRLKDFIRRGQKAQAAVDEQLSLADREEHILEVVAEMGRLEKAVRRCPRIMKVAEVRASLGRLDELRAAGPSENA